MIHTPFRLQPSTTLIQYRDTVQHQQANLPHSVSCRLYCICLDLHIALCATNSQHNQAGRLPQQCIHPKETAVSPRDKQDNNNRPLQNKYHMTRLCTSKPKPTQCGCRPTGCCLLARSHCLRSIYSSMLLKLPFFFYVLLLEAQSTMVQHMADTSSLIGGSCPCTAVDSAACCCTAAACAAPDPAYCCWSTCCCCRACCSISYSAARKMSPLST